MINTKIKYKRKVYKAVIPENWHEVKLKQVIALESLPENNNVLDVLSCFIDNVPKEAIYETNSNLWEELVSILTFVYAPPKWVSIKAKKAITLGDKYIKIPQKLNLEMFGQKVLATQKIAQFGEKIAVIPELLTIYLQPKYDGKYLQIREDTIKEMVNNTLAVESIPIGFFFYKKLARQKKYGMLGLNKYRKTGRALIYSIKQGVRNLSNLTT